MAVMLMVSWRRHDKLDTTNCSKEIAKATTRLTTSLKLSLRHAGRDARLHVGCLERDVGYRSRPAQDNDVRLEA